MQGNNITNITRQAIADEMQISGIWYCGRQNEPDFLSRMFDLRAMKSRDHRYSNAYDDVYQHTVNNSDYDPDWIYTDPRINLLRCDVDIYLKFLEATLQPSVRNDQSQLQKLLGIYNKHLDADGFEVVQVDEISGRPIFAVKPKVIGQMQAASNRAEIKRYLNTAYVDSKLAIMHDAMSRDTDLAIGTAKELLETVCKSILKQKEVTINKDWTLPQLLNATSSALDFRPKEAEDPLKAEKAIRQVLGGISTIIHGVSELRNAYGTGHGKDADFKGLEAKYAKLLIGVVSEIAILFLATNGEAAELVEDKSTCSADIPDDFPF